MSLARWLPLLVEAWRSQGSSTTAQAPAQTPPALDATERRTIIAAMRQLSAGLTGARELVGASYLDRHDLLGGYLLGYWPVSYTQFHSVLGELGTPLGRVLDLGCGPGPGALAAAELGATHLVAADRSRQALGIVERLALAGGRAIETCPWHAGQPVPTGAYDTILLGHVVNELYGPDLERRATLIEELLGRLAPGGSLVVIEPALRETSRELLRLRDLVVERGAVVRAPCLEGGPCPALARPSDWCHAERRLEAPALLEELAGEAQLHRDRVKMSYLVLASRGTAVVRPGRDRGEPFRIVSEPLHDKGRLRLVGCGPRGRHMLTLLERHVVPTTAPFKSLERGDVVRIDRLRQTGDGLRIEADARIELLARAGDPIAST